MVKKEIAAVGPAVSRALTPAIEKIVSTAIAEAFQEDFVSVPKQRDIKGASTFKFANNSGKRPKVDQHMKAMFGKKRKNSLVESSGAALIPPQRLNSKVNLASEAQRAVRYNNLSCWVDLMLDIDFRSSILILIPLYNLKHTNSFSMRVLRVDVHTPKRMIHIYLARVLPDNQEKHDTLREASFGYCVVNKLVSEAFSFKDGPQLPFVHALKKMQALFEKLENNAYNLSRTREFVAQRYEGFQISIDWMLNSGFTMQRSSTFLKTKKNSHAYVFHPVFST